MRRIGDRALTEAEKQRRARERKAAELALLRDTVAAVAVAPTLDDARRLAIACMRARLECATWPAGQP